jgi:hypothetical protein
MDFDKEKKYLRNIEKFNNRNVLSIDEVKIIEKKYPTIPQNYLNYLQKIGAGSIKDSGFNIYSNLVDFYDLGLNDIYTSPNNIKFFGDNFSGDFVGFDLNNIKDEVIEFWHDDETFFYTGKTFSEYILEKIYN